jgi:hypothetical protein
MTVWDFLEKHRQLASGRIIVGIGTMEALHAAGAFHGMFPSEWWERAFGICLAIVVSMVGSAVSGRAKETTAQTVIATAMQTAIQAMPGDTLPPSVITLAQPREVKP